ncbi:hypothetical protein ScalyP_jg11158 [Parmales sp. scaly parma]|nr:hypothetical protein ScalyP_jg11158 [Parmales sp. scaly parma]
MILLPATFIPQLIVLRLLKLVNKDVSILDGELNQGFAEHFPLFVLLRRRLGLTVEVSPKFKAAEAKPDAQFIMGFHPHGVGSDFRVLMQGKLREFMPNTFLRVRSLAASILFTIPFIRQLTLWTGCIDASRSVATRSLRNGRTLVILPGGEAEQLMTVRGVEQVYLLKRKGFVKLALRFNIPLVPAYVFGSNDLFYTSKLFFSLRWSIMKKLGVCIPFAKGTFNSFLPISVKNTIVVGDPITFEKAIDPENVTAKELNHAHDMFVVALTKIFDDNKERLGYGDRDLLIV